MVNVGEETLKEIFVGDMGIKTIAVGEASVYTRQGGYFYIELTTDEKEN